MPPLHSYRRIVRRHGQFRVLKDEFNLYVMLLFPISISFLIDPLDNHPKQIVLVAIQRPDLTNDHNQIATSFRLLVLGITLWHLLKDNPHREVI